MSRSAWRDLRSSPGVGELAGLSGHLDADDEQEGGTGPVVTIAISNGGPEDVSLVNPFELIQLQVTDAQSYPLKVPAKAASLLTGWRGLDLALPVVALTRSGEPVDLDAVDAEVVAFPAGGSYAISLAIDRFVEQRDSGLPQPVPVAGGVYSVGCTFTLISARDRKVFRTVRADPVRIAYTP